MSHSPTITASCGELLQEKVPNFFRLFLNPYVVQTCFCLARYVQTTWPEADPADDGHPSFLANSFDEALSGAIKLARYCANLEGQPAAGLVLDPGSRLGPFASVTVGKQGRIVFVPDLTVINGDEEQLEVLERSGSRFGFVVLIDSADGRLPTRSDALNRLLRHFSPRIVTCVNRAGLTARRSRRLEAEREATPDIVVFDESFVRHSVPFGAFTARKSLYGHWTQRGKSAFHSTTFQPNALASLHFLRCLEHDEPAFYASLAPQLATIRHDPTRCRSLLARLYSPFLARAIRTLGFATLDVHAEGHYVVVGDRKIFDGVAGVACSIRGHNPDGYVEQVAGQTDVQDAAAAVAARLKGLTGLGNLLPAVSGASAVENALRLGLVAQSPRKYVLALEGGFGGKTLFALTGTARASYKDRLEPLYEHVVYVDPFGPDALRHLEAAFKTYPIAVVQLELIQGVGGVRPVPRPVVEYLQAEKDRGGYLLFVDEVQTGMYRTGAFTICQQIGVQPDLLSIGKGTSDMMFPFALTLYSDAVRQRVEAVLPELPAAVHQRFGYDWGYRTVLNVLAQAEKLCLPERVAERGAQFAELLGRELAPCKQVRDVRVHGLLIGVELARRGRFRKWLNTKGAWIYLLRMLRHPAFPLFVGFCQYEPNVLKLTPPLTITPEEVRQTCATLAAALRAPLYNLLPAAAGTLMSSLIAPRR